MSNSLSAALARPRRAGSSAVLVTVLCLALVAAVLVVAKPRKSSKTLLLQDEGKVSIPTLGGSSEILLGYDPYNSISRPGKSKDLIVDDYGDDDRVRNLPSWATDWPADASQPCDPGSQCIDKMGNPLGELGKWVMEKTSPHYETARDYYMRHNCLGLPGWAVEECHRMREREDALQKEKDEAALAEAGEQAPPAQASETPAAKRARPTVLAFLGRRNAQVAASQQSLARSSWIKPLAAEIARDVVRDERRSARTRQTRGGRSSEQEGEREIVIPAMDVRMA